MIISIKIRSLTLVLLAICSAAFGVQDPYAPINLDNSFVSNVKYNKPENSESNVNAELKEELRTLHERLRNLEAKMQNQVIGQTGESQPDDRIEKLEESIKENSSTLKDFGDDLEALDDAQAGQLFHSHKKPKMTFFGRIHVDYWAFPQAQPGLFPLEGGNPEDRFNFRRMRIGIKGDLNDNMFYKYEGEFAGGEEPSYRDAILGFKDTVWFNKIIIGNHKRPYGLDHINSSRYNVFIERPFIVEAFNQDSRRMGVSSNGNTDDLKYNWRYGVWNQRLTQTLSGYIGDHYQAEFAARLAATPWYDDASGGRGYFHWGISGSVGAPDGNSGAANAAQYRTRPEARSAGRWLDTGRIAGANTNTLIGLESVFNVGALQIVSEYMSTQVERTGAPDVQFSGGYVYASYFLTGEHMPWDRKTGQLARIKPFENFFSVRDCDDCIKRGLGAWQVAARYSYADLTDDNIIGGEGSALTLAMNWYWNPYARMQFNYILGDIKREPAGSGDYEIIGARFMVDF